MKKMIAVGFLSVVVFLMGCGVEGLHMSKPHTRISAGPWGGFNFYNSKDVAVKLAKGNYDPETKALNIEDLDITDNASEVRRANVEQIEAITQQTEKIYAGWENLHRITMQAAMVYANALQKVLAGSTLNLEGLGSATLGTATTQPGG